MKNFLVALVILLGYGALGTADPNYIVLFKQNELGISSLEHGAFQNLLQSSNKKSVDQLQDWLGTRGLRAAAVADLWLVRGALLSLNETHRQKLAREPWVQGIYEDKVRRLITPMQDVVVAKSLKELGIENESNLWGLKAIGIPKIRSEFPKLDGTGIRIGIIDTGIQSKHPELAHVKVQFHDLINGITDPYDDQGHGTHVAGTIAGKNVGIARNASILFAKAFGADGSAMDSDLLRAMQWMFDPDGNATTNDFPQIVSNSWGGELGGKIVQDEAQFRPYQLALQAWIHGGIIPVFAAGNSGHSPNGFPGGLPECIAVGALTPDGQVAEFSSRGPNVWRVGELVLTLLKPDITAPGVKITSSFAGNKYATYNGTSMATPHVAGSIALLLQANPKLKFGDVKELLLRSSHQKLDINFGFGILDTYRLVKLALG